MSGQGIGSARLLDAAGKGRALAESGRRRGFALQAGLATAPWLAMMRAVATIPSRPPRPGTGAGVRMPGANRFHRPARRGASAASACARGKSRWRRAAVLTQPVKTKGRERNESLSSGTWLARESLRRLQLARAYENAWARFCAACQHKSQRGADVACGCRHREWP
jgi:hypothetical protein